MEHVSRGAAVEGKRAAAQPGHAAPLARVEHCTRHADVWHAAQAMPRHRPRDERAEAAPHERAKPSQAFHTNTTLQDSPLAQRLFAPVLAWLGFGLAWLGLAWHERALRPKRILLYDKCCSFFLSLSLPLGEHVL